MKKRVFKRKKEKDQYKVRRSVREKAMRAISVAAALCLMVTVAAAGNGMRVYGEENTPGEAAPEKKVVVTDIFHRHIGSADTQGGCYSVAVPHVHVGDEKNGGGCYGLPGKLHEHEGSGESGGGCYGLEIPHETHGEECYVEETHSHEDECYGGDCIITYSNPRLRETYTDTCPSHGVTTFERSDIVGSHSACGLGVIDTELEYCQICRYMPNRSHPFINCGRTEGTTQVLICTKTVERYETTCGFEQGQPESYLINCGLDADGYVLGCGLTEDTPCGRLILTGEATDDGKKVMVTARVEDLSGGKLILEDEPYIWHDRQGGVLGKGEQLEVEENGNYSVTVSLKNKDVDESGLHSSILVDEIRKEEPSATPSVSPKPTGTPAASQAPIKTPSASPEPEKTPASSPEASAAPSDSHGEDGEEDTSGEEEQETSQEKPQGTEEAGDGKGQEDEKKGKAMGSSGRNNNQDSGKKGKADTSSREAEVSPTPSASPDTSLQKEKQSVEAKKNKAAEPARYRTAQEKKRGLFQSAAVKVIAITAGTALLLAGILFLLLWLLCSVRIYNDNGKGKMIYLGRCLVRKKEEDYSVVITDAMTERSCTNRYCIRPGLFRLGKKEDQELVVYRETKKTVVPLSREMIVII